MKLKPLFLLLIATVFFSCESDEIIIDTDNLLLGSWIEPFYDGETIIFKRANSLSNDTRSFTFKKDGSFTELTSGFCGTPPLTFFEQSGTWVLSENYLKIYDQYNMEIIGVQPILRYNYLVIDLSENSLTLKREFTEQEKEHRNLMALFDEIQNLAYATSCIDASNWAFTAYGSKACGGPQGFMAYSKNMNTEEFLKKIEIYTQSEKEFNRKWGIISDCSVTAQPIAVACVNSYPTLIY
ncbi:hypothetical protein K8354_17720 [Polaribacter litorisediminis]|uniref:hypothetical protein n=1 Tax=Polaribacter litorisediminis TaxID=1908341 RepID=UPI001CBDF300|nr:hypothetical protein [Polaribacter litorisediminis]UAM98091.1 hypothetical protein K8354_17720 [Polaribacter litorisediminis]